MNASAWHLLLVHIPSAGLLVGTALLLGTVGRRATWAYACFTVAAVAAVAAYYTGPAAQVVLESTVRIEAHLIEQHALLGRVCFVGSVVLGVLSIRALLTSSRGEPRWVARTRVALVVILLYLFAWTSHLGGLIRHEEIRHAPLWFFPQLPS